MALGVNMNLDEQEDDRALSAPIRERTRPPRTFAALDAIAGELEAEHGTPMLRKGTLIPRYNHIETGIFLLDLALLGGVAEGQSSMFYGFESSGKTTLAMRTAASAQRKFRDRAVVYIDCEQTLETVWAEKHGLDMEALYYLQPDNGEMALNVMEAVLKEEETSFVVLDSIPALIPKAMAEAAAEDQFMAIQARLNARMCAVITSASQYARKNYGRAATIVMINQWRTKIGSRIPMNTLPGGNQIKFLQAAMVETKNHEILGSDSRKIEIVLHNEHAFRIKKNKAGNSIRNGEYIMIRNPEHPLGEGTIDEADVVLSYAKRMGFITGGGQSQFVEGIEQKFAKRDEMVEYMNAEENAEAYLGLKRLVIGAQRVSSGLDAIPPDGWLLGRAA